MILASPDGHGAVVLLRVNRKRYGVVVVPANLQRRNWRSQNGTRKPPFLLVFHQQFRANLESSGVISTVWKFVAERLKPAMKDVYGPLMALNVKGADWRHAVSELERVGLFGSRA